MSVNTDHCPKESCCRQPFSVSPPSSKGLICRFHHTIIMGRGTASQRIRFLHATFNSSGDMLAVHNHLGNVYIIDFSVSKYWFLVHLNCSVIKFVPEMKPNAVARETLLIGTTNGNICIYNSQTSQHVSNLIGHTNPINDISCSDNVECVTLANNEAIIWELESFTKLQLLQLEEGSILKFIMFIPVSNNLIGCFNDDIVQIWKSTSYETLNQMTNGISGESTKLRIRTIAFTSNGKLMAIAGHSPIIFVLDVETLKLRKEFLFTEMHVTVKKALFLPNIFDDGTNKILSFLTSNGTLFFYNMEFETLVNKITIKEEIWKFTIDQFSNKVAIISKTGEIQIHALSHILPKLHTINAKSKSRLKVNAKLKAKGGEGNDLIKNKMNSILSTGKLKAILKEFGEYPSIYRKVIWQHLLRLPCDDSQYTSISQSDHRDGFKEFEKCYFLEVKQDMESLKRFTELLIVWCPFLSVVSYLPVMIFPFIKFLQTEPVLCFELLVTLIVNYCQYWFEYHPVPPLNVMGLVESLLYQQDLEVLMHLNKVGVTSKTYAWFLLQSMFSEVLSASNWLIFCDHLMTYNATFLIVAVAAYTLINRKVLLAMNNVDDFDLFYRTVNNIDFKQFIARCYKLFNDKTMKNHPREYFADYEPFEEGKYPIFTQYPKNCLEICNSINDLRSEANSVKREEQLVRAKIKELKKLNELEKSQENFERHVQLNKLYCDKLQEEKENVKNERKKLSNLKLNILNQGDQFKSDSQINASNSNSSSDILKSDEPKNCLLIEEQLLKHYTNLLKYKIQIEGLVDDNISLDFIQLKENYKEISNKVKKSRTCSSIPKREYLMQLNIVTGLSAVDSLISKVESKILDRSTTMDRSKTKNVVSKLVEKSDELSHEITKLMNLIALSK